MALHQAEAKILSVLSGRMSAQEVASKAGLPESTVLSFVQSLREKGYVSVVFSETKKAELTAEGRRAAEEGLPEQKVLKAAKEKSGLSLLPEQERAVGIAWATKNGWVKIEAGKLAVLSEPEGEYPLQSALLSILRGESADQSALSVLSKRKLIRILSSKEIYIEPTPVQPEHDKADWVNALSREMLLSGSWRQASFRPYDIQAPVEVPTPAKRHPIALLKRKISLIFAQMGFEEMQGSEIQSSFWNFDALFQPQDHPARDLADTFYLKSPSSLPADSALVERVRKVHESCWGGNWDEQMAAKKVLRTHTTAVSASYLYNHCRNKTPKKYFCIGKVFRNEATDYKHLAEFFQVEGIVVWEKATFRDLLGCLKAFYSRLGFEKIRFQPSYFPYTEPSLEIAAYFEKKQQWIELGGAGIFRPEVSIPLCDRYPVLAWGLSLERPLMLMTETEDIRSFYKSSVGWLKSSRIG
ncbi:MAG: phenylalanine--tRNA ligase subunit alpha [Candidatus Micrarchaeota archaeon]|nr:phenylalanine--tRNA ligase subunit alpha [Candidatus Micrarchaeota archaeon]